ncbi:MAG: Fe(3+) ABC transporter substrate-binding protein [Paracoccaceae bacterium]|nr:iron ABC transporter substrate-binding protein [Marinovum sp.]|tara:strand:+ start:1363 stop:2373 length:1011 start_codon:yes stop_codon:yes gene_type:complete
MKKFVATSLFFVTLFFSSPIFASEVNIYSYRQPFLIEPLTTAFTDETGIKVNIVYLRKGMIERMKAEGKRSPADVVLTVDISRLSALVEAGLTQQVVSQTLSTNVPEKYRDPAGHWFGLTTRARIIYVSKERVRTGEIKSYEDLADPKWRGKVCTRSGLNAYNLALTSAIIHHHGEDYAKKWLDGFKQNLARKPQGNDRAQVKAIWAGECDLSIGNTYYMGKMLKDPEQADWAKSVNIVFPTFEGGGTHVNVSGIGMAKFSPNKDNALALMEFLSSGEAQEIYATANFEYPIAPGTKVDDLVKSWGSFNADNVNLMTIAKLRKKALKLTEIVDFDG